MTPVHGPGNRKRVDTPEEHDDEYTGVWPSIFVAAMLMVLLYWGGITILRILVDQQ